MSDSHGQAESTIDSITQEFVLAFREGRGVAVDQFISQYPEHADELREVLPTVLAMEKARSKKLRLRSDGKIAKGAEAIKRLGDFTVVREIGRGGMGIVYEAIQDSLQRSVALKILPSKIHTDPDLDEKRQKQFEREATLAAGLHHTNIVPIYGVGQHSGYLYYVMQLIHGTCLNELSPASTPGNSDTKNGRLPYRTVAEIGRQVASALAYAHENSVLHRDVKPANLLQDEKGTVWVTDFGLAANTVTDHSKDRIAGTLHYLPPESLDGKYDCRSEIYCLGITLIELLHGRPVFGSGTTQELTQRIKSGDHHGLKEEKLTLPVDFRAIMDKATQVDPNRRFQSAEEMLDDLENFLNGRQVNCRKSSTVEKLWRWSRFNRELAAMSLVVALLLMAVAASSLTAYWRVRQALKSEQATGLQARQTSDLAESSMDRIFERFAPDSVFSVPDRNDQVQESSFAQPVLSSEAASLLDEMLNYYLRLDMIGGTDEKLRGKSALGSCRVAEIYELLGDYEAAARAYQNAIRVITRLKNDDSNNLLIATARNHLGAIQRLIQNDDRWRDQHYLALDIVETLPKTPEVLLEAAQTHYFLGRTIRPGFSPNALPPRESSPIRSRRPPPRRHHEAFDGEQRAHLDAGIQILNQLGSTNSSLNDRKEFLLGLCKREQAPDHLAARTDRDSEVENEAIAVFRSLTKRNPGNPKYRHELIQSLGEINVFSPVTKTSKLAAARKNLEEAIRHGRLLVRDRPDVPIYESSLIHANFKLAVLLLQLAAAGESVNALESTDDTLEKSAFYFRRAINRQRILIQHSNHDPLSAQYQNYRIWLARFMLTYLNADAPKANDEFDRLLGTSKTILKESSATLSLAEETAASPLHESIENVIAVMQREVNRLERSAEE